MCIAPCPPQQDDHPDRTGEDFAWVAWPQTLPGGTTAADRRFVCVLRILLPSEAPTAADADEVDPCPLNDVGHLRSPLSTESTFAAAQKQQSSSLSVRFPAKLSTCTTYKPICRMIDVLPCTIGCAFDWSASLGAAASYCALIEWGVRKWHKHEGFITDC